MVMWMGLHTPEKPSMARRPFHFSAKGVKGPTERESGFSPALQQPGVNQVSQALIEAMRPGPSHNKSSAA